MLKMNTSFSKYVKQCKWGLGLDTAGSDYSAHQLARLLTTILGRLPGPSARRWEGSPAERGAGGRPASPGRSGRVRVGVSSGPVAARTGTHHQGGFRDERRVRGWGPEA